jgi:hypothetical protein
MRDEALFEKFPDNVTVGCDQSGLSADRAPLRSFFNTDAPLEKGVESGGGVVKVPTFDSVPVDRGEGEDRQRWRYRFQGRYRFLLGRWR